MTFTSLLSERYLAYALSTITARSLPDVRDGLKPVHRRLIYAMQQLHLNPTGRFKKSARVVGDVMGKFHPHGDMAIYEALVRLAQDFSVRYPLIDGQGNFGNIDGDHAAAMRYTEARLTAVSLLLLEGLGEEAVAFRPTYDSEGEEPLVLPAAFPNLLANGSSGIAVGMATNIPPHNVAELCSALLHLIRHRDKPATTQDMMAFIPGPDFPTGGIIVEPPSSLLNTYEKGRGTIRLRARWEKESLPRGAYRIIVTEIPYQVSKSKLLERMADLLGDKKLPLLGDLSDESTEDVRLILHPKSNSVDPEMLMELLFKETDLETRFPLNMNVLVPLKRGEGEEVLVPRVLPLPEVLRAYLDHRLVVCERRTTHQLKGICDRLHLLEGFHIVFLNLDEVIRIIREEDEAEEMLQSRFHLSERQVEAILNLRLRALRKLHELEILQELDEKRKRKEELEALLTQPEKQWQFIAKEIKELQKKFSEQTPLGKRRTTFAEAPVVTPFIAPVEKEEVTVILSRKGWVRVLKGHKPADIKYKEGDGERFVIPCFNTDRLIAVGVNGRSYSLVVDKLPRMKGSGSKEQGDPLTQFIDIGSTDELVGLFMEDSREEASQEFLLFSKAGYGFRVRGADLRASVRSGKQVFLLDDSQVFGCLEVTNQSHMAVIGENRKLLIFDLAEIPLLPKSKGVRLQRYKLGEPQGISDARLILLTKGLSWLRNGKEVQLKDLASWTGRRAALGSLAPINFPRNNRFEG